MTFDKDNPYSPSSAQQGGGVCLITDLPGKCPSCDHTFNLRFYPRRYQTKTILYLVVAFLVAAIAGIMFGRGIPCCGFWLVFIIVWVVTAAPALRFPKVVHLKCRSCGWSHRYIVRNPQAPIARSTDVTEEITIATVVPEETTKERRSSM